MRITEIELLQLGEALKGTEACLEKAAVLAGQCEDHDVRNMLERTHRLYQQHHEEMTRLVNEATAAEGYTAETRRNLPGQNPQGPGYTTPGWSGPSYGATTEHQEGPGYPGHIRT